MKYIWTIPSSKIIHSFILILNPFKNTNDCFRKDAYEDQRIFVVFQKLRIMLQCEENADRKKEENNVYHEQTFVYLPWNQPLGCNEFLNSFTSIESSDLFIFKTGWRQQELSKFVICKLVIIIILIFLVIQVILNLLSNYYILEINVRMLNFILFFSQIVLLSFFWFVNDLLFNFTLPWIVILQFGYL